jgi:hypothetical protein
LQHVSKGISYFSSLKGWVMMRKIRRFLIQLWMMIR